ncbi:MAG: ABC transporter substrate-binding protein [Rhodospirillaceae bacterium]|nr:ABC transporter substrate-binding protein [Rhodospirillaceae bacterium]MBT5242844.1 ABC transporter substrate-binding protein [Rhodospirillaceae bacterium]MBT5561896.1 ABC transporter substrate-binding protein [Rhodospirillaceae bacterium]MBT6241745.1 ABC transporter substrate-binding protein [Rhodospirillaceae bacterium]
MKKLLIGATLGLVLGTASVAQAKTLVFCSEGSPGGFNPSLHSAGTDFDASAQPIYNRLVEFEPGTTKVVPGLAESWSATPDGLSYTFKLRKGVKWHSNKNFTPTRDFNADDVLFSFNRQWKEDHPYNGVSGGKYLYFGWMDMGTALASIDKIDDYTVKITLNSPDAPFVSNLAMDFASILSAEYADKMASGDKERVDNDPIGTGPFEFVSYKKDAFVRFKAFDQYWEGKPKIDKLVFAITVDAQVRYQKLKAGECHIMPYPNPADIASMKKDKDINLLSQEGLNVGYIAFNAERAPFDDVRVRRALSMAINKQAILDVVYKGAGSAAKNPIPPTMWSYNDAVVDYPYDPKAAKALLAEAGAAGLDTDIWAMPVARPYNPNARRIAELVQADWAKIGVTAKIVSYEWGEYRKRIRAGEHGTAMLGWTGDNGDPDNFMFVLLGCEAAKSNAARWCNTRFDKLLRDAKLTSDQAERTKLYEQAQVVFKREAPWFTIAHSVQFRPVRKEVVGFKIHPLGSHIFKYVDLK